MRLFLQQVQRLDPDYAPSHADLQQIAEICRQLEGMPLAIELAAAWIRSLSLTEIEAAVQHRLDLLTTTLRDVPERHRSMLRSFRPFMAAARRSASGTCCASLPSSAAAVRLAAAAAVAGATPGDLEGLVDKSWLRVRDRRFTLPRTDAPILPRQARTRSTRRRRGEAVEAVHRRHCAYFAGMARAEEQTLNWQREPMAIFSADFGNLEAAWHWALAHGEFTATRQMMNGLFFVAEMTGWYGAMLPYFERCRGRPALTLGSRQETQTSPPPGDSVLVYQHSLH